MVEADLQVKHGYSQYHTKMTPSAPKPLRSPPPDAATEMLIKRSLPISVANAAAWAASFSHEMIPLVNVRHFTVILYLATGFGSSWNVVTLTSRRRSCRIR